MGVTSQCHRYTFEVLTELLWLARKRNNRYFKFFSYLAPSPANSPALTWVTATKNGVKDVSRPGTRGQSFISQSDHPQNFGCLCSVLSEYSTNKNVGLISKWKSTFWLLPASIENRWVTCAETVFPSPLYNIKKTKRLGQEPGMESCTVKWRSV